MFEHSRVLNTVQTPSKNTTTLMASGWKMDVSREAVPS